VKLCGTGIDFVMGVRVVSDNVWVVGPVTEENGVVDRIIFQRIKTETR
jgi:hypothetical protein